MRRAKQTVLFEQWEMQGLPGLPFGDGGPDRQGESDPEPQPKPIDPAQEVHHE